MKKISRHYLIFLFSLFFISCNDNPKSISDYELRDNLIYKVGAEKPYTGRIIDYVMDKRIEYDVVNGKKEGEFLVFNKNGNAEIKGEIIANKYEGKWEYYYPDGTLESEGYFHNDQPESRWIWYHRGGEIKEEGYFSKGQRVGKWIAYDEQGKVVEEQVYPADTTNTESH